MLCRAGQPRQESDKAPGILLQLLGFCFWKCAQNPEKSLILAEDSGGPLSEMNILNLFAPGSDGGGGGVVSALDCCSPRPSATLFS